MNSFNMIESPQLTETYPFLEEILNRYDELDHHVDQNDQNIGILNLCDDPTTFNRNLNTEQKITCKKIIRKIFLCNGLDEGDSPKCCVNLYFWLGFEIKKNGLTNDIIQKIFELPNKKKKKNPKYDYCPPYTPSNDNLNTYEESIKLSIFNLNEDKFQNLLNNTDYLDNCFFKSYFHECVKTYKALNEQYCSEEREDIPKKHDICEILSNFSDLYTTFLEVANNKGYEFPDLSSSKPYDVVSCTSKEINEESSSTASNNSDKHSPHTVSTTIGTMAAIPPFLALIYKFTPVGTWFRSKIIKSTINFDNIDEEIENELFYPTHKNAIANSSNAVYNVAYGQV